MSSFSIIKTLLRWEVSHLSAEQRSAHEGLLGTVNAFKLKVSALSERLLVHNGSIDLTSAILATSAVHIDLAKRVSQFVDVYLMAPFCFCREPEDAERVLQMIANKNKPIEQATFRTMLTIITACQALEPKTVTTTTSSTEASTLTETPFGEFNMPPDYNMWSIISGILPGTSSLGEYSV